MQHNKKYQLFDETFKPPIDTKKKKSDEREENGENCVKCQQ